MKKLLTIALLAASAASFAQGLIGPKIGLNFSNIKNTKTPTGNTADDYSYVVTPSAGIVFNAQIGEHFAIRPEVLWVQRGANLKDSATSQNTKIVTNYVEVPFNLVGRIK